MAPSDGVVSSQIGSGWWLACGARRDGYNGIGWEAIAARLLLRIAMLGEGMGVSVIALNGRGNYEPANGHAPATFRDDVGCDSFCP